MNKYDETATWLRERAKTQDRRGEHDAARDNRELADLLEQRVHEGGGQDEAAAGSEHYREGWRNGYEQARTARFTELAEAQRQAEMWHARYVENADVYELRARDEAAKVVVQWYRTSDGVRDRIVSDYGDAVLDALARAHEDGGQDR